MTFGAKAVNQPVGYGSLCDDRMNTRQPPFRTARPDAEGQALEHSNEMGR